MAESGLDPSRHFAGVDWPASKGELVEQAKVNRAPPQVVDQLNRIPDRAYGDEREVRAAWEAQGP